MNYRNIHKYDGEMSSSDLCDAIVEAKSINIPEVRDAARLLVDDLRDSILSADKLYYLESEVTGSPHINEHFGVFLFDDCYYVEKFLEKNTVLHLRMKEVVPEEYEKLFTHLYDCGAECVDYCNDNSNVTFGIEHYFLSDDYNSKLCSARLLSRFVLLCMQEIRNSDKLYERKDEIVTLLKKNIIAESLGCRVLIPVRNEGESIDGQLVNVASGTQMNIATMNTESNEVFFPVYTNVGEFNKNPIPGLNVIATSLLSYIDFVYQVSVSNPNVFGLAINPNSVNFAMNKGIMEIILNNRPTE